MGQEAGLAPPPPASPVKAVVFDLDDTLFLQSEWLAGAWRAVATEAAAHSAVDPAQMEAALVAIAAEGSDKGRIIDRALERLGVETDPRPLVQAFRLFRPSTLAPLPGVADMLRHVRSRVPLGLVSDGDPEIQTAKLELLGLSTAFDAVVLSDLIGRQYRKPDPTPFRRVLEELGVDASDAVYVGDRPDKDVIGARGAGMRVIRVRTGEYAERPSGPGAWAEVDDALSAAAWLAPFLPGSAVRTPSPPGDSGPPSGGIPARTRPTSG